MALYILLISVVRAIRCNLNCSKTSMRGGCTVGPTRSVSFNETPEADFAEASKTALTLVVELELVVYHFLCPVWNVIN